jgi:hypothetical protein
MTIVKIQIVLSNVYIPLEISQSMSVVVTDLATKRSFNFSAPPIRSIDIYDDNHPIWWQRNPKKEITGELRVDCCDSVVTLYSEKSFDHFIKEFYRKFAIKEYDLCCNNCSDTASFVLDYFFPEKKKIDRLYAVYKVFCCWGFLGTAGCILFPGPCFMNLPGDIYKKAKILSYQQSQNNAVNFFKEEKMVPESSQGPTYQRMFV